MPSSTRRKSEVVDGNPAVTDGVVPAGRPMPEVAGVHHSYHQAGSVRLHVAEAGEGPPLVLLHGWPQHWYAWRKLIPELAKDYRVICPDLRGFGWSDVPSRGYDRETMAADIISLLDELGIERFRLGGHDWGGWIAFLIALHRPERVESLLALGIPPPFSDLTPLNLLDYPRRFWYQYVLAAPLFGARAVKGLATRRRRLLRYWWGENRVGWKGTPTESFHAQWREPERVRASVLLYRHFLNRDMWRLLGGRYRRMGLKVPTLLIIGAEDHIIRANQFPHYHRHADQMALARLPDVGHFIVDEAPQLVRERAQSFFIDPEREITRTYHAT